MTITKYMSIFLQTGDVKTERNRTKEDKKTYPQCCNEITFDVVGETGQERFTTGDHSHTSRHVSYHMVSG